MSTKFPKAWTMVKVMRKTAERMVPFLLLSKLNFRFPVKKTLGFAVSKLQTRKGKPKHLCVAGYRERIALPLSQPCQLQTEHRCASP